MPGSAAIIHSYETSTVLMPRTRAEQGKWHIYNAWRTGKTRTASKGLHRPTT